MPQVTHNTLVAKNLTLSVPDDLAIKMDSFKEINWSQVARGAIETYIAQRESPDIAPIIEKISKEKNAEYALGWKKATLLYKKLSYSELDELNTLVERKVEGKWNRTSLLDPTLFLMSGTEDPFRLFEGVLIENGTLERSHYSTEYLRGLYNGFVELRKKTMM